MSYLSVLVVALLSPYKFGPHYQARARDVHFNLGSYSYVVPIDRPVPEPWSSRPTIQDYLFHERRARRWAREPFYHNNWLDRSQFGIAWDPVSGPGLAYGYMLWDWESPYFAFIGTQTAGLLGEVIVSEKNAAMHLGVGAWARAFFALAVGGSVSASYLYQYEAVDDVSEGSYWGVSAAGNFINIGARLGYYRNDDGNEFVLTGLSLKF